MYSPGETLSARAKCHMRGMLSVRRTNECTYLLLMLAPKKAPSADVGEGVRRIDGGPTERV
jgi:hypothetical protein